MKRCVMFVALAIVAVSVSFASAADPWAAVATDGCGCAEVGCDAGCVAPVCTPCLPTICVKPIALPTFRLPKLFVCKPVCLPAPKCPLTACDPCGACGEIEGCGCGCGDVGVCDGCGNIEDYGCDAGCAPVVCAPVVIPVPDLCGALAQAKCNFERDMCAAQACAAQNCMMVKARMAQIRCQPI